MSFLTVHAKEPLDVTGKLANHDVAMTATCVYFTMNVRRKLHVRTMYVPYFVAVLTLQVTNSCNVARKPLAHLPPWHRFDVTKGHGTHKGKIEWTHFQKTKKGSIFVKSKPTQNGQK